MVKKMAVSEFRSSDYGENELERGPRCSPIYSSLNKAVELLVSVRMNALATL